MDPGHLARRRGRARLESNHSHAYARRKMSMSAAFRAVAVAILAASASQGFAQGRPKIDPDWPCQQVKTPTFSLASIWTGPPIDLDSQAWRDEPDVGDLAAKMSQRRVPIEEVDKAIIEFKAKAGTDSRAKLLRAFGAAFQDLTQQRSQILEGLDRFGRKQREMADHIRAESEAARNAADQNKSGEAQPAASEFERLQWDLRVFEDRRRTVGYVCEAPALIEQRLGAIARAVHGEL
jgi:hypothetical protein